MAENIAAPDPAPTAWPISPENAPSFPPIFFATRAAKNFRKDGGKGGVRGV